MNACHQTCPSGQVSKPIPGKDYFQCEKSKANIKFMA
jgi:hypothetical protein